MAKITEIFGQFDNDDDRETFMQAQLKTISNLTRDKEELQRKVKHLEDLLKVSSLPTANPDQAQEDRSYQELICVEQLKLLNSKSQDNELTAEEARKVDIYSKILLQVQNPDKKVKSPVDGKSIEELLKLAGTPDEKH